jgi:adenylate cyclase
MGTEIERKFLVADDSWRVPGVSATPIRQGYMALGPPTAVRVRIAGETATLNVKTATLDIRRHEFEYAIPVHDAEEIMATCCAGDVVEKTRFAVPFAGAVWEVDVFAGLNEGLVVAEIELNHEDQPFDVPPWAGAEVSHDPRYLNTHLSQHPFSAW